PVDSAAREETEGKDIVWAWLQPRAAADGLHGGALGSAIAGQLSADELVIRDVGVDGVDYPITPIMDPGRGVHALFSVGVSQQIETVAAIADAILVAGQKAIDQLFIGVWRFVVEISLLLSQRRRDADEVHIYTAQQRALVSGTDRRHFFFHIQGLDEGVY